MTAVTNIRAESERENKKEKRKHGKKQKRTNTKTKIKNQAKHVHAQAAAARRVLRDVTLSRDEFDSVAPHVGGSEPSRTCLCLVCNVVLNKRRAAKHFEEVHGCNISWARHSNPSPSPPRAYK